MKDVLPLILAFAGGAIIETINWSLTRYALDKKKGTFAILPIRCVLAACYIAALYFAAKRFSADFVPVVIAGVVGLSAGLLVFTILLMRRGEKGGRSG